MILFLNWASETKPSHYCDGFTEKKNPFKFGKMEKLEMGGMQW